MSIRGKAFIAGAYEHPLRNIPDRSTPQVHAEVALGAVADAGLTLDDVDGYFCAADAPGFGALSMADYLGLKNLSYLDSSEMGGSSYVAHVGHAAAAIAAGKCSVALITLAGRPRNERFMGGGARFASAPEAVRIRELEARIRQLEASERKLTTEREILRRAAKYFAGETNW